MNLFEFKISDSIIVFSRLVKKGDVIAISSQRKYNHLQRISSQLTFKFKMWPLLKLKLRVGFRIYGTVR